MRDIWVKHWRDTGILEGKKAGNGIFKIEIRELKGNKLQELTGYLGQTLIIYGILRPTSSGASGIVSFPCSLSVGSVLFFIRLGCLWLSWILTIIIHILCHYSFCNLTVEFGVQVHGVRSAMQEIPTFVVLGSACLTIVVLMLSAFHTAALCSEWPWATLVWKHGGGGKLYQVSWNGK